MYQTALFYDRVAQRMAHVFGSSATPTTVANGVILKNTPNRVLVVSSGSTRYIYLNGLLVDTPNLSVSYVGNVWILGASFTTMGGPKKNFFSGQIGNLRIYDNKGLVLANFTGSNRKSRAIKINITSIRTEGSTPYRAYKPWTGIFRRTGWGNTWNRNYSGRV